MLKQREAERKKAIEDGSKAAEAAAKDEEAAAKKAAGVKLIDLNSSPASPQRVAQRSGEPSTFRFD